MLSGVSCWEVKQAFIAVHEFMVLDNRACSCACGTKVTPSCEPAAYQPLERVSQPVRVSQRRLTHLFITCPLSARV